jgi:hypothetical protein
MSGKILKRELRTELQGGQELARRETVVVRPI